jgi:hypothetical protein
MDSDFGLWVFNVNKDGKHAQKIHGLRRLEMDLGRVPSIYSTILSPKISTWYPRSCLEIKNPSSAYLTTPKLHKIKNPMLTPVVT